MLLNNMLNFLFLLILGSHINWKYSAEISEEGSCDSPMTLCVTKNREKTFECVFEGKREED